jgi:YfiH family protein
MAAAEFLTAKTLQAAPLRHGFFTRRGGISAGPFAALNCSLSGRDDDAAVRTNRARAMEALDLPPSALLGLTQVHGREVVVLREPTAQWPAEDRPKADAMVTDVRGLALGIVTADCGPVLFADAEAGIIGAAHAGWRGAVAGVLESVVEAMTAIGARPSRIAAAIGPCIRQPSYEVGADLRDEVVARSPADARFFANGTRPQKWQFDLAGYCAARLAEAGVERIEVIPADTLADETRFFSHRRNTLEGGGGPIGHQLSAIALA